MNSFWSGRVQDLFNNVDNGGLIGAMAAGDSAHLVSIPSVFISKEDCQLIKDALLDQENPQVKVGPVMERSSSFDNAVIAHEYGHGI